jgi:hypothetical protein
MSWNEKFNKWWALVGMVAVCDTDLGHAAEAKSSIAKARKRSGALHRGRA